MADARIVIAADGSQAIGELDKLKAAFGSTMSSVQGSAALAAKAVGLLAAGGVALSFASSIKGAIDLADSLNKLSQRTGVATESLSQLQYAAKLADVSSESLTTALKKLNVSIAGGIAGDKEKLGVFQALGITLTDTAGKTKTADQVLLDIADTFAKSKDGAGKTAAAVALLGKAGDEMVPLLNGGKEGIIALMKEADKLGLTIGGDFAKQAEEFNDNLTRVEMGSKKLAISLAGDLVQGLGAAMKAMADAVIEGGKLQGVIAFIQTLLTGDDLHKANVATVKGTELVMAAEAALDKARASGDTARIDRLTKALALRKQELATDSNYRVMLEADADKAATAAKKIEEARTKGKEIKLPTKTGDLTEKESEYAKLNKQIQAVIDLDNQSLDLGRELTEAEKLRIKVTNDMNLAKVALTAAERESINAKLAETDALAKQVAWQKQANDENKKYYETLDASTKSLRDQVKAQQELTDKAGLQARALQDLEQAKLQDLIADKLMRASVADIIDISGKEGDMLREQAELLRQNAKLKEQAFSKGLQASMDESLKAIANETAALTMTNAQREVAIKLREIEQQGLVAGSAAYADYAAKINEAVIKKDATDQAVKSQVGMWQTIESTAKDTFISIFNSGKNTWQRLKDSAKNTLFAYLYEMTLKKFIINIGTSISGAGVAQQAFGAATGGGDVAGAASTGSSLFNIGSTLASGASAFGGAFSAGAAIGTEAFGAGVAMMTSATGVSSFMAGAGQALGAMGPVGWAALGAVALTSLLSGGGETRSGSAYVQGSNGKGFREQGASGGGFSDAAMLQAFDTTTNNINLLLKAVGSTQQVTSFVAGFESSRNGKGFDYAGGSVNGVKFGESGGRDGGQFAYKSQDLGEAVKGFALQLKQTTIEALQAATDIPVSIKTALSSVDAKSLSVEAVDKLLTDINTVIISVNGFRAVVNTLPFENLKNLSFDAANGLLAASGGLEKFNSNLGSYYTNFYTEQERADQATQNLTAALSTLGVNALPKSREAFRALVDAQDTTTESGQRTYAALLAVAGAFASLTPTAEAAAAAMQAAKAEALKAANSAVDEAFSQVTRAVNAQKTTITAAYEAQTTALKSQFDGVSSSIGKLQNLSSKLKSSLDSMKIMGSEGAARLAGQATIAELLATARSGGGLPIDSRALDNALSAVAQPSEQLFSSFTDYAKDFFATANDISALNDLTDKGLTEQQAIQATLEAQLAIAKASYDSQIAQLDAQLKQADAMANTSTALLSVAAAMAALAAAVGSSINLGQARTVPGAPAGGTVALKADPTVYRPGDGASIKTIQDLYSVNLGRQADAEGLAYWSEQFLADGMISNDEKIKFALAAVPEYKARFSLAVGTNYVPRDMLAQIHEGEAIVPRAYNPAAGGGADNADMVAELRAMRAELAQLCASQERNNEDTKRAADRLDGRQGVPFLVQVAT